MNVQQLHRMRNGKGFVAALDQSGGSTPKALKLYGIDEDKYKSEAEMFDLVHEMRSRIIRSPAFSGERIIGAILFEDTLRRSVDGVPTASYLWNKKNVAPFLKVDKGLEEPYRGSQLMKPMPDLDAVLGEAADKGVFGAKMRSLIKSADEKGIAAVVEQQFAVARKIMDFGLAPIIEPEVDIRSEDRGESEIILLREVKKRLAHMPDNALLMFKFSIPVRDNFYQELMADRRVLRIVALSGGYSRAEANEKLKRNHGIIASFSRALTEGLSAGQSDDEFNAALAEAVESIYEASVS